MSYSINDRVIVRISAHTLIEGRVAEVGATRGTLRIETQMIGVDISVRGDVVADVVRPADAEAPVAEPTPEARLMAGAVWGINRAMLDASGREKSEARVATQDGYVWAFVSQDDAKREAAGLSKRYAGMGNSRGREYRYSVTPFTLEEAAAAAAHGYALNGNHPETPTDAEARATLEGGN